MNDTDDKRSWMAVIIGTLLFVLLAGGIYTGTYLTRSTYEVVTFVPNGNGQPTETAVRVFSTKIETYLFYPGTKFEGIFRRRPVTPGLRAE
jgi:hypothetical protein